MPDREKVISAYECVITRGKSVCECGKCDYHIKDSAVFFCDNQRVLTDVLAVLKEQQEQIDRLIEENASNAEMAEGMKELLKEQEAVEPLPQNSNGWVRTIRLWYCGACHSKISRRTSKYCPNCGKPILWEGR